MSDCIKRECYCNECVHAAERSNKELQELLDQNQELKDKAKAFYEMAHYAEGDIKAVKGGISSGTVACRLFNELLAFVTLAKQQQP